MTFSKINPLGWATNEELFSSQMNQLDTDHANAVDKTGDTIDPTATITFPNGSSLIGDTGSTVQFDEFTANTGNISDIVATTLELTDLQLSNGTAAVVAETITVDSGSTINSSATMSLGGASITISAPTSFITSTPLFNAGATVVAGTFGVLSGAFLTVASGATLTIGSTGILTLSGTNKVKLASRSLTRVQPYLFAPFGSTLTPSNIYWVFDPVLQKWQTAADAQTSSQGTAQLMLPNNCTLTSVTLQFKAPGSHVGFPVGMPQMFLRVRSITSDALPTAVGSVGKNSGDYGGVIGNYDSVIDTLTISGLSVTIDNTTKEYYLDVFGESGTNALKAFKILGWSATYTVTEMDDGK